MNNTLKVRESLGPDDGQQHPTHVAEPHGTGASSKREKMFGRIHSALVERLVHGIQRSTSSISRPVLGRRKVGPEKWSISSGLGRVAETIKQEDPFMLGLSDNRRLSSVW